MFSKLRAIYSWLTTKLINITTNIWIFQKEKEPPVAELYVQAEVEQLKKIILKLSAIDDENKIKEILEYTQGLYESEEKRREHTENKATLIAGFAGTATAGLLVFLNFFLDTLGQAPGIMRALGVGFAGLSLILLVASIFFSITALKVRGYHCPNPMRIFDLAENPLEDVWKRRAAEYFYSYVKNQAVDDRKLDAYKYADKTFQWSIYLIIPLVILIFICSVHSSPSITTSPITPTATLTSTPTLTSTATLSATFTASPSPTMTATATSSPTLTPSATRTSTPTVLPITVSP